MKLRSGAVYEIHNLETGQWTYYHSAELYEKDGAYICYGFTTKHDVRVFRGVVDMPERPACFLIVPSSLPDETARFTALMGGLPLALKSYAGMVSIMNWDWQYVDGPTGQKTKTAYIDRGMKVLEAFRVWQVTQKAPEWLSKNKNALLNR